MTSMRTLIRSKNPPVAQVSPMSAPCGGPLPSIVKKTETLSNHPGRVEKRS